MSQKIVLNTHVYLELFSHGSLHIKVMGFLDGAYQSDLNFSIRGHIIFVNDIYMHVSKYKVGATK